MRLGQVALVGQLITGEILGPYLLGPFYGITVQTGVSSSLTAVQCLATFFILFMAGMEIDPADIYGMKRGALLTGLSVFLVPFGSCLAIGFFVFPGTPVLLLLFIAVLLSITALPNMRIMISEFGLVGQERGRMAMTVALVNQLAAITVFAVLLQAHNGGGNLTALSLGIALGSVLLFLVVVLVAHRILAALHRLSGWQSFTSGASTGVRYGEAGFALLMVLAMGAALLSQWLGLTFVIGAFYAGILVTPTSIGADSYKTIKSILRLVCWGPFIPLFFAISGLQVNLTVFLSLAGLGTILVLLAVAALSKIGAGALAAAKARGLGAPNALAFGFIVISRGAVEIAMAVILLGDGILSSKLFTLVVAVGMATTILAPIGATRSWMLTAKSREDLVRRMPNLAAKRPRVPLPATSHAEDR